MMQQSESPLSRSKNYNRIKTKQNKQTKKKERTSKLKKKALKQTQKKGGRGSGKKKEPGKDKWMLEQARSWTDASYLRSPRWLLYQQCYPQQSRRQMYSMHHRNSAACGREAKEREREREREKERERKNERERERETGGKERGKGRKEGKKSKK